MLAHIAAFLKDDSGVTALEYGLVLALISVASMLALTTLGGSLATVFGTASSGLTGGS